MFEQLLVDLLNKILGDYVDNLSANQLNVGVWAGDVVLRNLKLKKDVLSKFDLPFEVKEGYMGLFAMSIPWASLKNKPVRVDIEDIFLLVSTISDNEEFDPVAHETKLQRLKQERLDTAEILQQQNPISTSNSGDDDKKNSGFVESLLTKILDNLQIHIKNVHIRLEDSEYCENDSYAIGVTISELYGVSTNRDWVEMFIQETRSSINKLFKLDNLSIYWNSNAKTIQRSSARETIDEFRSSIPSAENITNQSYQFVLRPVSGIAKLLFHKRQSNDQARISCLLEFDDFSFIVDNDQYRLTHLLFNVISRKLKSRKYIQFRPPRSLSPKTDPKAFWRFAIKAILHPIQERNRRWSWDYFLDRKMQRLAYVKLWKLKRLKKSSPDEIKDLQNLEKELCYDDIIFFRTISDRELRKELPTKIEQQATSWMSWLTGNKTVQNGLSVEERRFLYETIEFDETAILKDLVLSETATKFQISFKIASGSFSLAKRELLQPTQNLFEFSFRGLGGDYYLRPRSYLFHLTLEDLTVWDGFRKDNIYPYMIRAKENKQSISSESLENAYLDALSNIEDIPSHFFDLTFEESPLDQRADYSLQLKMKPLEIIYVHETIHEMLEFLKPSVSDPALEELRIAAELSLQSGLRNMTKAGLSFSLSSHKTWDVQLDIDAPIVIIPENCSDSEGTVIVADLGHLKVASKTLSLKQKEELLNGSADYNIEEMMYDKFNITFRSLQILVGKSAKGTIRSCAELSGDADVFFLPKTDINLELQMSINVSALNLSRYKIHGDIPSLQVNFSNRKYNVIQRFLHILLESARNDEIMPVKTSIPQRPLTSVIEEVVSSDVVVEEVVQTASSRDPKKTIRKRIDKNLMMLRKLIQIGINIRHLKLKLSAASMDFSKPESPIADLVIDDANLDGLFRLYDFKISSSIKSVTIFDNYQKTSQANRLLYSSTEENSNLIKVIYHNCDHSSPEYKGIYHEIDTSIQFELGNVVIDFNRDTVAVLLDFFQETFSSNDVVKSTDLNEKSTVNDTGRKKNMKFFFFMSELRLYLIENGRRFLDSTLQSVSAALELLKDDSLKFSLDMNALQIYDIFQNKREFIKTGSSLQQMLSLVYDSYPKSTNSADDIRFDSALKIKGAKVFLTFSDQFITEIIDYFSAFAKSRKRISEQDQQETLESLTTDLTTKKSLMRLDVDLDSPIVRIPISSLNGFALANLGVFSLHQTIDSASASVGTEIRLQEISLRSTINEGNQSTDGKAIIENFNLIVDLKSLPLESTMSFSCVLSDIHLLMNLQQYHMLLDSYAIIMRSAIVSSKNSSEESKEYHSSSENRGNKLTGKVSVGSVSIQLLSGFDTPLSSFCLKKNVVDLRTRDDGSIAIEAAVFDLIWNDERPGNILFRDIIPQFVDKKDQLHIEFSKDSSGYSSLICNINRPQILLVPELLFEIKTFLQNGFESSLLNKEAAKSLNESKSEDTNTMLSYRVNVMNPEVLVLRDSKDMETDAMVLGIDEFVLAKESIISLAISKIKFSLCKMNNRNETLLKIIENFDFTFVLDSRIKPGLSKSLQVSVDIPETILFRISYHDVKTVIDISQKISELFGRDTTQIAETARKSMYDTANNLTEIDGSGSSDNQEYAEEFSLSCRGVRAFLIDDLTTVSMPMFEVHLDALRASAKDWSKALSINSYFNASVNFFNIKNSYWEPILEPWKFAVDLNRERPNDTLNLTAKSLSKLDITISHSLIESYLNIRRNWSMKTVREKRTIDDPPYIIRNETGSDLMIWSEEHSNMTIQNLPAGTNTGWRFESWRNARENLRSLKHRLCVQLSGSWETLKGIRIDKEGERVFLLNPTVNDIHYKLVCDVRLQGNVKEVIFRSNLTLRNCTPVSLEIAPCSNLGVLRGPILAFPAGRECHVPIKYAFSDFLRFRPEGNFGYDWSPEMISWRSFAKNENKTATLASKSPLEEVPDFFCHVGAEVVGTTSKVKTFPNVKISFFSPLELENLLPYKINYTIFDKTTRQQFSGVIETGKSSPLHSVALSHLIGLKIQISDSNFGASTLAIINSPSDQDVDSRVSFIDENGQKVNIDLLISDTHRSNVSKKIVIYSPYIVMNKSGLPLEIKAQSLSIFRRNSTGKVISPTETRPLRESFAPMLLSFSGTENLRHRVSLKTIGSDWSIPFGLDAIGSISEVSMRHDNDPTGPVTVVGVSIENGIGKFQSIKVINLAPRFIVINQLHSPLFCRVFKVDEVIRINPEENAPFYQIHSFESLLMAIKLADIYDEWSSPINFNNLGKSFVKLVKLSLKKEMLVRVDISMKSSTIYIRFTEEQRFWPYRIENRCGLDAIVYQWNSRAKYRVKNGQSMFFTWDEPAMRQKVLILNINGTEREVNIQEVGPQIPFAYKTESNETKYASLKVVVDGQTFVLHISEWTEGSSIFRRHSSASKDLSVEFEEVDISAKTSFCSTFKVDEIGISIVDQDSRELVYISAKDLNFTFRDTNLYQTFGAQLRSLQVDNQLFKALDPVVMFVTGGQPARSESGEIPPLIQAALVRSKDVQYGIEYYKYFSFLLQEISVSLDEDFLFGVVHFFDNLGGLVGNSDEISWNQSSPFDIPEFIEESGKLYFEVFQVQPVKLNISFFRSDNANWNRQNVNQGFNPLSYVTNIFTMAVGNVSNMPIRLNALIMEHPLCNISILIDLVSKHYTQEVVRQVHKLIGSADVLGNPVGLFNLIGSGVKDVFYEPYLGFVSDRPQDFGIGLAKGTASFLRKTVYGVSDTFSKFTGSVGKGLASATMDKEYQEKRREAMSKTRSKQALSGVTSGASSFASSVLSGVTGILEQPLRGAEKEGVGGFFKGIGKGLVGAVTKPMVGVLDLASSVTSGIRNSTVGNSDRKERARHPRHIGAEGIVRVYNQREALGSMFLRKIDHGKFNEDTYVCHLELDKSESPVVLFVTDKRILTVQSNSLTHSWMASFEDIDNIRLLQDGKTIVIRSSVEEKKISLQDHRQAKWLFEHVNDTFETWQIETPK